MTAKGGEVHLVRLDVGSADVIGDLVEKAVGCGNTLNLQSEDGPFGSLRHALFCRAMFATAEVDDSPSAQQCVAMGGNVEGCPVYGMTMTRQSRGEHEKLRILVALQKEISASLTHSDVGNFNTVSGSKLDKS